MAYNASIPQANDQISQSQQQLLDNFQAINSWVNVNHINFANADMGKHNYVTFPAVPAADPVTAVGELSLYSSAALGVNRLFMKNADQTASQISGPITAAIPGQAFLFGGLICKWGQATITGGGYGNVAFNTPFPTACWTVFLQHVTGGGTNDFQSIQAGSLTVNGFNARSFTRDGGSESSQAFYLAIGN